MKRRILSFLISLALCVSLCPAAVLAEGKQPAAPTQTVEGETGEKDPDPSENTPGGGTTENPETKPEGPGNPEIKPEEPEDTETKPETPGETETKPETLENPEIKPEVPENPEVPGDTETKQEIPENPETKPETAEKEISKFKAMRASAESSSISVDNSNFVVSAQGIPIIIKENSGITSIYDEMGNLLSGETDVRNYAIYGGGGYDKEEKNTKNPLKKEKGNGW